MSTPTTTQQRYPGRATARTVLSTILSTLIVLGIIAPIVLGILQEELAEFLPDNVVAVLVTGAALLAAVSAALTRIMAIPAVDQALARIGLSSSPAVGRHELAD